MEVVDYYYVALGIPASGNAFALSWLQASVTNVPLVSTTNPGVNTDVTPEGYADYYANALMAGYGWSVSDQLSLGISAAAFYKDMAGIAQGKGAGITTGLGLLYQANESLSYGVMLSNILNWQKWATNTTETVYPTLRLGAKWQPVSFFIIAADMEQQLAYRHYPLWHLGSEVNLFDRIKVRAGFDDGSLTAGLSASILTIYFDYGYLGKSNNQIGDAHRVTLGITF